MRNTKAEANQRRRVQRRLAAILAADLVGYSRMMGEDEAGTLAALKELRQRLFEPSITAHDGRLVKLMGDGALVEFASAVDAVACAVAIQRGMAEHNADLPDDRRMQFRIGLNLGDVMIDGDDVYGDGVNIAARLEGLAEPGGICISAKVHDEIRNKLELAFADLGEQRVKNISEPVRAYQIRLDADAADNVMSEASPAQPDKPSIVVLAFENMSRDPEQEYFADGIAEDVITDLSKISGLFVIARNSAFSYKGKALNLQQVSRELGVRFVLEGSVRKAGNRVRITAQLIDGATGGHLWAERYDRDLTDIFDVQDEVTLKIVKALKVHLTPADKGRIERRSVVDIEAYDLFLRGRHLGFLPNQESIARSQLFFEQAITRDPSFAPPIAYLAITHALQYVNRWSADPENSLRIARQLADKALALDPSDAHTHLASGIVHVWMKQVDRAITEAEQAIALDPNFADAYALLGSALHYAGRSEESFEKFDRVARLDPNYPPLYLHFMAQSHFALGRYEEAITVLKNRLLREPDSDISHALLASCYGHLGRVEEARSEWQEVLRIKPDYAIEERRRILPYKNPRDFDDVVQGLRKAGISV